MSKKNMLIGALVLLSGCSSAPPPAPSAANALPPPLKRQVSQIETAGIQVIQQGDRLTMIISTDSYFDPMSTTVKDERQTDLREMAKFAKSFADTYPNSVIKVTGYTDKVFSHRTQLELSQSYADAVSAYIFNAGADPRRIATQGRGSNEPIAGEYEPTSAALNRRVVVQVN